MPEIKILSSLREIGRNSWDACFPGEPENYDYLLAIEESGIKGFSWKYVAAWCDGVMVAAIPAFLSDYELDTTLQGTGKKITNAIKGAFPNLLKIKLACLGSPCTEIGLLGFHPGVDADKRDILLKKMLTGFEDYAASQKCKLIGIKDIPETMENFWQKALEKQKYAPLPSLPTAYLDIDFKSIDEYLARLSHKTRKDMRRKLKTADLVRIEHSSDVTALLPQIIKLYTDTRSRSEWQLEELTEDYFRNVLANMPGNSFCTLYYANDQLLAANLLIHNENLLLDKFFCMNSEIGRDYNLYFLSWFNNLSYCIKNGIKRYQSGQANYGDKLRLGSKLTKNSMYFRHRNFIAQSVLKLVAPLLAADETEKEAA